MARLRFSDGEQFETSGQLRIEHRRDGLYVVGEGMLIPCDTYEEAANFITDWEQRHEKKEPR